MPTPAFRQIEDDLRAFFGRCCRDMTSHEPEAFAKFVRPHFTKKRVTSLDHLELADYCHVLLRNYCEDREHAQGVLFERHLVEPGIDRDIRYCKDLRNRYAHLAGTGDPVAVREQYSDIVVVQRAVRILTVNRPRSDADNELLARLDRLARDLVDDLAKAALPEKYDQETGAAFSESQRQELLSIVTSALGAAQPVPSQSAPPSGVGLEAAVISALTDLRRALEAIQLDLRPVSDLERTIGEAFRQAIQAGSLGVPPAEDTEEEVGFEPTASVEPTDIFYAPRYPRQVAWLRPFTAEEARSHLIALRRRIWSDCGTGPSTDGLLRKSMIDAFLHYRPTNDEELQATPLWSMVSGVPTEQQEYLPEVYGILARLER